MVLVLAQRDKIERRFFRAFAKAGTKDAYISVVGTILHYDCLFQEEWFQFFVESDLAPGSLTTVGACDP